MFTHGVALARRIPADATCAIKVRLTSCIAHQVHDGVVDQRFGLPTKQTCGGRVATGVVVQQRSNGGRCLGHVKPGDLVQGFRVRGHNREIHATVLIKDRVRVVGKSTGRGPRWLHVHVVAGAGIAATVPAGR